MHIFDLRQGFWFEEHADAGGNGGEEKKTLKEWQAQLDTAFAERGKQGANAKQAEILSALGVATLEEAQTKLKAAKDAEAASQTELQKAQTLADTEKKRADAAEEQRKAALAKADEKLLRAAVVASATTQGIDDAEQRTLWLLLKDDAALRAKITPKTGDEDEFDGVEDVVKGLLKDHPKWLKTATTTVNTNATNRGGGASTAALKEAADAQARQTRNRF